MKDFTPLPAHPHDSQNLAVTFSVVIPLHNKRPHIAQALRSALEQTYPPIEIIVVDDASTDGSLEEVRGVADSRIRILYRDTPGPGGYAARNVAVRAARGEWIAFLDADDLWQPNHLAVIADTLGRVNNPTAVGCVFSGYENLHPGGITSLDPYSQKAGRKTERRHDFDSFLSAWLHAGDCPIWTSASAFRRSVLENCGLFPEGRCLRGGDKDLWLRVASCTTVIAAPAVTATFRRDAVNKVTHKNSTNRRHKICETIDAIIPDATPTQADRLRRLYNLEVFNYAKQTVRTERLTLESWRGFHFAKDPLRFCILTALSIPGVARLARMGGLIRAPGAQSITSPENPPKARLLFVVTKRNKAGAQLVAIGLARGLRARGYHVTTCFLYEQTQCFQDEPDTLSLADHPPTKLVDHLRIAWRLGALLRRSRPRSVHTFMPFANVLTAPLALACGIPHRIASLHYPAGTQGRVLKTLDAIWGRLGLYTGVVAVSRFVASSLVGYSPQYHRRVTVIHNGVPERPATLDRRAARLHFGLPADAYILGNVGRLEHQKNHDLLIEIARNVPEAFFVVAGEGAERARLERMIHAHDLDARVRLLGNIPEADIPNFLAAADVFILTSHYEGLPLSVIEAMQAGVPILASDIPSVREIVAADDEQPAAILAPLTAAQPWVTAIKRMYSGEIDTASLIRRARIRTAAFRMAPMVEAYERALCPPPHPGGRKQG